MEPSYQQQIHERNQSSAEVDSLKLLWGGTMKQFTPEARRFEMWLRLIGYVETTRNINEVHRQFIRREGMMLPGELIRYMDCLVGPDSDVAAKGCNFTISILSRNHLSKLKAVLQSGFPSTTQRRFQMKEQQTLAPEEAPKAKRAYKQRLSKTDAEKAIRQLEVTYRYVKKDTFDALKSKECSPGTNSRLAYLKAWE